MTTKRKRPTHYVLRVTQAYGSWYTVQFAFRRLRDAKKASLSYSQHTTLVTIHRGYGPPNAAGTYDAEPIIGVIYGE